jgi:hypothetical protein
MAFFLTAKSMCELAPLFENEWRPAQARWLQVQKNVKGVDQSDVRLLARKIRGWQVVAPAAS